MLILQLAIPVIPKGFNFLTKSAISNNSIRPNSDQKDQWFKRHNAQLRHCQTVHIRRTSIIFTD